MDFADFIRLHDGDDLGRLALERSRHEAGVEDFSLALTTLEVRRKLREKVPEWHAVPSLRYPLRLSGEQCSSSETARYKAGVALAAVQEAGAPLCLADLTGGLGVDSWAFAQVFDRVLYNEMRPELADAAAHNFRVLGMGNIRVSHCALGVLDGAAPGMTVRQVLDGFAPDIIYLDPARRASDGRKVFRLEDCQPDVSGLLPELLAACPLVLLKLSPMADISLVCKQLGCVRAVHVVGAGGECKELLLLLERGWRGPCALTVYDSGAVLEIPAGSDVCGQSSACDLSRVTAGYLFEPGKALLKAGAFDLPCRYGLEKLGRHTHLYTGAECVPALSPFGKWFRIVEAVPLNKRTLKDIGRRYPRAEVTARNVPLTSDQLRARLVVTSGGPVHIFGLHTDTPSANLLFICAGQ